MKTLVWFEIQRIWKKKSFLIVLCIMICVQILMCWYMNKGQNQIPLRAYKKISHELQQMPEDKRFDYVKQFYEQMSGDSTEEMRDLAQRKLRYTDELQQEIRLAEEVYEEFALLDGYQSFLSGIEQNKEQLSGIGIFSKDNKNNFSYNNIQKTAHDYKNMNNTPITLYLSKGYLLAFDSLVTDVILIVLLFFLASILIFEEKSKGLFLLTKAAKRGRVENIVAKVISLAVNIGVLVIVLYGCNMIYYGVTVGLGPLQRSMQSVGEFMGSTWQINLMEYTICFAATKWIVLFVVGMMILMSSILFKYSVVNYLVCTILFAVSYILYQQIPALSPFNWLKYINLVSVLDVNHLYGSYLNLNWFETPISHGIVGFLTLTCCCNVLLFSVLLVFCKKKSMPAGHELTAVILRKLSFFQFIPHVNMMRHECYKLLIKNRAWLFLLLFAAFQMAEYHNNKPFISSQESIYRSYMKKFEGKLTKEKERLLKNQEQKYNEMNLQIESMMKQEKEGRISRLEATKLMNRFNGLTAMEPIFRQTWEQYLNIQKHPKAEFVYDTGYLHLLDIAGKKGTISTLPICILLILCFSDTFTMEKKSGMQKLIHSTAEGRQNTSKRKCVICIVLAIGAVLLGELPELLLSGKYYGYNGITAPAISILSLKALPVGMTILHMILLQIFLRLWGAVVVVLVILLISKYIRSHVGSMTVCSALLLGPVLLSSMGIRLMTFLSVLPLYNAANILSEGTNLTAFLAYLAVLAWGVFLMLIVLPMDNK